MDRRTVPASLAVVPSLARIGGRARAIVAATACTLLQLSAAHAQTNAAGCRDDLPMILQPSNCAYQVHARTTPPPAQSAPKPPKKTLAELLRERDGAGPRPQRVAEIRPDGAYVLKARMGAN